MVKITHAGVARSPPGSADRRAILQIHSQGTNPAMVIHAPPSTTSTVPVM